MKILLIDPPRKGWWLLYDTILPNLGLAHLASYIEKYLHNYEIEIKIIDCSANKISWNELENIIENEEPNIIGVSAITCNINLAYKVCELAKKVNSKILTVIGGPHPTFCTNQVLNECKYVDVIVRGEGEETFKELVLSYMEHDEIKPVNGISYRINNRIIHCPDRNLIEPLDKIPAPAWHLLPMDKYRLSAWGNKAIIYVSSRGCPFKCIFCSEWKFWRNKWRGYSANRIFNDMRILVEKYDKNIIWFGDDTFNVDRKRIIDLCNLILENNLKVNWGIEARIDLLYRDLDLIKLMREAGLIWTLIGIESPYQNELSNMEKNIRIEQINEVVKVLKDYDIIVQGMFIIGTPNDTRETILEKAEYALKLDLDFTIFTPLTPLPGTILYEWAKNNNLIKIHDYSKYDFAHAIMDTWNLSYSEVQKLMIECYKKFYFNPIRTIGKMFSRNKFRRAIYWHFIKLLLK